MSEDLIYSYLLMKINLELNMLAML